MAQSWTQERLFFSGDDFYQDLLHEIALATVSIDFETYIFDPDRTGQLFETALSAAAKRGVQVRLLVDGIGSSSWSDRHSRQLVQRHLEVRIYHPIKLSRIFRSVLADIGVRRKTARQGTSLISRLNRRDHRKLVIIDSTTAWVGSINISDVHSAAVYGALTWRDTAVRLTGKEIRTLERGFEHAWLRSRGTDGKRKWRDTLRRRSRKIRTRSSLVRLNYTLRLRRHQFAEFSRAIRQAQERIWITNAYFAPSLAILRGLVRAAKRGAEVKILVPRTSDVFFMPWVASAHFAVLIAAGVKIYEYQPRFLHAKTVIIDGWFTVGTSNLNRRSLLRDFEVDVVLRAETSKAELEKQFALDLKESKEVLAATLGWRARAGRIILSFFRRWL